MSKKDLANAFDLLEPTQETKYNVRNTINTKKEERKPFFKRFKRPAAALTCFILASLLVISAAAIGGLTYFKALYGDKTETLTPYGITIGTSVQNDDVILTLHESVADDYTTAYIFSIRGLTEAGKALVVSNTFDSDAYETGFQQTNTTQYLWSYDQNKDEEGKEAGLYAYPPEITDCKIYSLRQISASGELTDFDIGLRYDGVTYDTLNNAFYIINPIESLREEDCEYYALYIVTSEAQQLTLTFGSLELSLPEATAHIPGVEVQLEGYIQDYCLNEGCFYQIRNDYPTSAVLTPLGLYVNENQITKFVMTYRTATLVFNDGSEAPLSEISSDNFGIFKWHANYFRTYYKGVAYLFNEIMDVSTVKSLLFGDELEFFFDGSTPYVHSTERFITQIDPRAYLYSITNQLLSYVENVCPDTWTVEVTTTLKQYSYQDDGWSTIQYPAGRSLKIYREDQNGKKDASFTISMTDLMGGTLEEEALAMFETLNAKHRSAGYENDLIFTVIGTGEFYGIEVLVVECGETSPALFKRCIFALYKGGLLTIEYDGYTGHPNDYAFDALLDLITFD